MIIKQSAEDVIRCAFVGKKFIGSEFHKPDEFLIDFNNNEETDVKAENVTGKTIKEVNIVSYGYCDRGISLKFDEFDYYFFFFDNDTIAVEE